MDFNAFEHYRKTIVRHGMTPFYNIYTFAAGN